MKRIIGLEAGKEFDFDSLPPVAQKELEESVREGLLKMIRNKSVMGKIANNWVISTDSMGVYGNFYLKRAIIAMIGLGANPVEDAVYPMAVADAEGNVINGDNDYILHFEKNELPPTN